MASYLIHIQANSPLRDPQSSSPQEPCLWPCHSAVLSSLSSARWSVWGPRNVGERMGTLALGLDFKRLYVVWAAFSCFWHHHEKFTPGLALRSQEDETHMEENHPHSRTPSMPSVGQKPRLMPVHTGRTTDAGGSLSKDTSKTAQPSPP